MQVATHFGRVLMSNTMLFSSPLGQTYFSVFGDGRLTKSEKEATKAVLNVIKFYKIKESDKNAKKKDKSVASSLHFWSVFILLIINEYSIGRHVVEDNEGLKETLTLAEISGIPADRLDNYINCVKIVNNVVDYLKSISDLKLIEKEAIVFIASFIKICSTAQGKDTMGCVMSILRFRKIFSKAQMKKINTYIKRISEEIADPNQKETLNALIDEIEAMREDKFGQEIEEGKREGSQREPRNIKMEPEDSNSQSDQSKEG